MIKFEKAEVWGWEHAIRGMRNPMNSWARSDTEYVCNENGETHSVQIGQNDYDLMAALIKGGTPHRKFLRQIFVSVDITAPLYWWKEFDTYKVGTTANSCSTMHKIAEKEFTIDDFSHEHLSGETIHGLWKNADGSNYDCSSYDFLQITCDVLNFWRRVYLKSGKQKDYWWQMIQLLPSSYNQKRTVTMTYENLLNILEYRRGHKLDEWRQFCDWIFTLPQSFILNEGLKD